MRRICATLILLGPILLGPARAGTVDVTYTWTPPTTGCAVDHYVVQLRTDGGDWETVGVVTTNQITLQLEFLHNYVVRVAGMDAANRQGEWSEVSELYRPDCGVPGACGQPARNVK